jgi:acyl-CoA synthetase (AMP-forming)/AMP-acid ligase II
LAFSLAAICGGHKLREFQAGRFDLLGGVDTIMCDPSQLAAIAALPLDTFNDASLCVNLGRQRREKVQHDVRADIQIMDRFSKIYFSDAADNLRDESYVSNRRQNQLDLLQETLRTVIGVKDAAVFPSVKHSTDENVAFIILADGVNRLQRFALIKKAIRDARGQAWLPKKMWQVDSIPKKESGAVDIGQCQDALRKKIREIDGSV